jgi:diguanylate cyclase (GGDEF)-like protein/PAS domain S-box-containing protein
MAKYTHSIVVRIIMRKISILIFSLIVGLITFNYYLFQKFNEKQDELEYWVNHTHEVIIETSNLIKSLTDAETGQRGYLLTLDKHYLKSYLSGKKESYLFLEKLKKLTNDNPNQQVRLKDFESLMQGKFDELKLTIDLSKQDINESLDIVKNNSGKDLMKKIRVIVKEIISEEENLLEERKSKVETYEYKHNHYILIVILIELVLVSFILYLFTKQNTVLQRRLTHQLESDLKQSLKRFEDVSKNISDWIWEVDKEGRYTYVSAKVKDFLGYEPEEILGHTPFETMPEDEAQKVADLFIGYVKELKPFRDIENINLHKNGNKVVLQTTGFPIFDKDGNYVGYRGTDKDITEKKEFVYQLEKEREKFKSITNFSSDGIFIMTLDDGSIIECSEMASKLLGYTMAEMKALKVMDWDKDIKTLDDYKLIIENVGFEPVTIERVHTRKDGSTYIASITIVRITLDECEYLYASTRDITKNKELEIKNDQLAKALDISQQAGALGTWDWNLLTNGLWWSSNMKKLFGYSNENDFKNNYESFIAKVHPDDRELANREIQKALEGSKDYDCNYRILPEQNEERIINAKGIVFKDKSNKPIRMVGSVQDVTELQHLISELKNSQSNLKQAQTLAKIGHWELDIVNNKLYWSDEVYRIFGLVPQEFGATYEAFLKYVHTDDIEKVNNAYSESVKDGSSYQVEHRVVTKQNEIKYVQERCTHEMDANGNVIKSIGTVHDITESVRKNKQIQEYISLVNKYIITSSTDLDGNITYVSDAFCEISEYTKEELIGKNHRLIKHHDMNPEVYEQLWETITENQTWQGEIKNRKKNGDFYWVHASISPTYNDIGEKTGYTAIRQDITDKKMIEEISITDGLTNIYNRRHFNEIFPKMINSAKRANDLVSFLIMDIDHFKQYNDTYGHHMGDDVLIKVATAIKKSLHRSDDYCFRLGGEEFGIIFKVDSKEKAIEFSNNIRQNIEKLHIEHSGNTASAYVTASMGLISKNANDIQDNDEVYKSADKLLYQAKESGRNKVCA